MTQDVWIKVKKEIPLTKIKFKENHEYKYLLHDSFYEECGINNARYCTDYWYLN